MRLEAVLAALLLAGPALAEPGGQRMITNAEAASYHAVGRLNVARNRHCTAVLIAADLVLSAAHCLYNARTGRRTRASDIRFVAGQRRDAYAALREVRAFAIAPDYVFAAKPTLNAVASDVALLLLAEPIGADAATPAPVAEWPPGAPLSIVAYGRDRAYRASIREGCGVVGRQSGVVALDCTITFGVSGAPVFADGPDGRVVVAVVSAIGEDANGEVALVAPAASHLGALRAALAAQ